VMRWRDIVAVWLVLSRRLEREREVVVALSRLWDRSINKDSLLAPLIHRTRRRVRGDHGGPLVRALEAAAFDER
jgi:hypothetical protein